MVTGDTERNRIGLKNAKRIAERLTCLAYSVDTRKSFDDALDSWDRVITCAEILTATWSDKNGRWEYGEIQGELKDEIDGAIDQLKLRREYAWP